MIDRMFLQTAQERKEFFDEVVYQRVSDQASSSGFENVYTKKTWSKLNCY
jgi:hypothetical protein